MLPNGSFEEGLVSWSVLKYSNKKTPTISTNKFVSGNKSVYFTSHKSSAPSIRSGYIAVEPDTRYRLSAWMKGVNVAQGETWWKKTGIWGWWYDKNYRRLEQFSLLLPPGDGVGTFNWQYMTKSQSSPKQAAYFCINRLGFYNGSTGEAWIDDVRIIKDNYPYEFIIYARDFTNGLVLINMGSGYHKVKLKNKYFTMNGNCVDHVTLNAHQGTILLKNKLQQN